MRWRGRRASVNVIDRRGARLGGRGIAIGGGGGIVFAIIALIYLLSGGNPQLLTDVGMGSGVVVQTPTGELSPEQREAGEFIAVVLADTEDVWHHLFAERGGAYREPKLVLFTDATRSGCGFASAAVGPFYCPADETIYIDLEFFAQMRSQLGAAGDFAQAYVIAHEVGHHVQKLRGTMNRVHGEPRSDADQNEMSVRLELQADFYAGVWAHHAQRMKNILEPGDIEEALRAASAVGDDTLQRRSTGRVVPDSFTHGTSAQRVRWFRRGFESGDPDAGDTFTDEL
jgi:predicted metalloprotease